MLEKMKAVSVCPGPSHGFNVLNLCWDEGRLWANL